jgi:hypothetical protein
MYVTSQTPYASRLGDLRIFPLFETPGTDFSDWGKGLIAKALDEVAAAVWHSGEPVPEQVGMSVRVYLPKPTWNIRLLPEGGMATHVVNPDTIDTADAALQELCKYMFANDRSLSGLQYTAYGRYSSSSTHAQLWFASRTDMAGKLIQ